MNPISDTVCTNPPLQILLDPIPVLHSVRVVAGKQQKSSKRHHNQYSKIHGEVRITVPSTVRAIVDSHNTSDIRRLSKPSQMTIGIGNACAKSMIRVQY
mmetsp:Transcript_9320/g.22627  ORF Transcript_9320/g.22627 Transcript_9320/m.22627 type:complete len:99 (-) Transcript_9320:898-1194(-)